MFNVRHISLCINGVVFNVRRISWCSDELCLMCVVSLGAGTSCV